MLYEVDLAVAFYSALSTIKVTSSKCAIDENDVYTRTIYILCFVHPLGPPFPSQNLQHFHFDKAWVNTVNFWAVEDQYVDYGGYRKARSKPKLPSICSIECGWGQKKFSCYNLVSKNGYLAATTPFDYPNWRQHTHIVINTHTNTHICVRILDLFYEVRIHTTPHILA